MWWSKRRKHKHVIVQTSSALAFNKLTKCFLHCCNLSCNSYYQITFIQEKKRKALYRNWQFEQDTRFYKYSCTFSWLRKGSKRDYAERRSTVIQVSSHVKFMSSLSTNNSKCWASSHSPNYNLTWFYPFIKFMLDIISQACQTLTAN